MQGKRKPVKRSKHAQTRMRAQTTRSSHRMSSFQQKHTSFQRPSVVSRRNTPQNTKPTLTQKQPSSLKSASELGEDRLASGVWTKTSPKAQRESSRITAASKQKPPLLSRLGGLIIGFFSFLLAQIWRMINHSWATRLVSILLIAIIAIWGGDTLINSGKIYPGVSIGGVDVGGKTVEEAADTLNNQYAARVNTNTVVFFADEQAQQNASERDTVEGIEEQISYEESLSNRTQWTVLSSEVEATFDGYQLAQNAYDQGRSQGGVLTRLQCAFTGVSLPINCTFNEQLVEDLRQSIIASVGYARVNYNIEMIDSTAQVSEGHAGREVTSSWLFDKLNEAFLSENTHSSYIVEIEDAPLQITQEQAQKTADIVNASLASGIDFTYKGTSWHADKQEIANWVGTEVVENNGSYQLEPYVKDGAARTSILTAARSSYSLGSIQVTFDKDQNGSVVLHTDAEGEVPEVNETITTLNDTFFTAEGHPQAPRIEIQSRQMPDSMSLDEGLMLGAVSEISSFTTQYSSGAESRNHNIHLAADYLNNSIVKANGGTWSFNDTAGEANEEKGYQGAGAIIAGQYSDAIGGGICQVATTVFNAVYEAGYPVVERHNHSLYIASYPDGRDAAVSYPDLDLIWSNDTSSDILLTMSYTDDSVTCHLYGVDPGYEVSTTVGEWVPGKKFTTKYRNDDTEAAGTEYTETTGADGRSITIVQTVKDANGNVIREEEFHSNYRPKDEIIVRGTAT